VLVDISVPIYAYRVTLADMGTSIRDRPLYPSKAELLGDVN
jgi:hypothetical protein